MENQSPSEFEKAAAGSVGSNIVGDFWYFLKNNKKWWLLPILLLLMFFGALMLLSTTAFAPFIYTLF